MDLKKAWKNLEKEKLSLPVTGTIAIPKQSKHPVAGIINTFALSLVFCTLFGGIFMALIFVMDQLIVQIGLAVITFFYGVLFTINWRVLHKVKALHKSDEKVLNVLHGVHAIVSHTIKFQQRLSWIFFPICVAGGFVLGVSMKKDAAAMMVQPKFYLSLIVTMAVITPAAYLLSKWMTNLSHGKYLKQIDELIRQAKED
ncbi:MAG TPA: hypothetical protein VGD40_25470 [Chryseosolibacter sp.]